MRSGSQCFDEEITGEYFQFEVLESINLANTFLPVAYGAGRVQDPLEVNLVLHGWIKSLKIINYMLSVFRITKYRFHLIPEQGCRISKLGIT